MASNRLWQVTKGYLAGCLVATLIVTLRLLLKAPDALAIITALLAIGMIASIAMTILPFMVLACISEAHNIQGRRYHVFGGTLLGLIAIFASYGQQTVAVMTADVLTLIAFLGAGSIAGLTYWHVTGSTAGNVS